MENRQEVSAVDSAPDVAAPGVEPLTILRYGDPALSRPALPVMEITPDVAALAGRMIATMLRAPGGGLAAPQVGVSLRIITLNPAILDRLSGAEPFTLINPRVAVSRGEIVDSEGCLSVPGIYADLARPAEVEIAYTRLDGVPATLRASGYFARGVLHELDHLDGVLFWDRLNLARRIWLKARYRRFGWAR